MRHNVPLEEKVAAVQQAVREALLDHALHGDPVSVRINGELVWLSPEETMAEIRRQEEELAQKNQVPNG
jgi:undecaprenyl pyrophosphate synthase